MIVKIQIRCLEQSSSRRSHALI